MGEKGKKRLRLKQRHVNTHKITSKDENGDLYLNEIKPKHSNTRQLYMNLIKEMPLNLVENSNYWKFIKDVSNECYYYYQDVSNECYYFCHCCCCLNSILRFYIWYTWYGGW